jgi:hypothetical protein
MASEILTDTHKTQRMASDLTFLERYDKDGDEFLDHVVSVTGDETWVLFVNVETKEQSKHWIHIHHKRRKSLNVV